MFAGIAMCGVVVGFGVREDELRGSDVLAVLMLSKRELPLAQSRNPLPGTTAAA
jgi:hypothetical protein